MAGVILAAGAGTRLSPLTILRPKALCPVDNRPLVDWALERISAHCADVAVNIHHHQAQMQAHLADRGMHLSVESPVALGTAGALGQLRGWIDGRPILLSNADAWHPADAQMLGVLLDGWDGQRPRLLCVRRADSAFGNLKYVGSALLPWWSVAELRPEPSGLFEVSWGRLHAAGQLELVVGPDLAVDCGTHADYLHANMLASGGQSVVAPGAVVEGTLVRSVVWPNSRVSAHETLVDAIRAGDLTVQVPDTRPGRMTWM